MVLDADLAALYEAETRVLTKELENVVRAFVQLRDTLSTSRELAKKFNELERKVSSHDQAIAAILSAIRQLMAPPEPRRRPIGFVTPEEKTHG